MFRLTSQLWLRTYNIINLLHFILKIIYVTKSKSKQQKLQKEIALQCQKMFHFIMCLNLYLVHW